MSIQHFQESLDFLTRKQVVTKDRFMEMTDALRLRSFTIAKQTEATVLQKTLDAIDKTFQQGGTLWDFRQNFPDLVKPYTEAGRDGHLAQVFRTNVRQAQATGAYQARQSVKRVFPYVEYRTGPNPRPSHAALDGKIFEQDDPFLLSHTPPWEHGCNCDLIPRTAAQVGKIQQEESDIPVMERRVVAGNTELQQALNRGRAPEPGASDRSVDVRPPSQKPVDQGDDYSFRPDQINQPVDLSDYSDELRARLTEALKARGYTISDDGLTAYPPGYQPTAMKSHVRTRHISAMKSVAPSGRVVVVGGSRRRRVA